MVKTLRMVAAAAALMVGASAWAADYQFDVIYSGNGNASLAPTSQDPLSVSLLAGDTFTWTITASDNNEWRVLNGGDVFPMMALGINEPANRTGDFQFDLLNDGVVVLSRSETGSVQSQVHMGTNTISLPTGLVFDRWELRYRLVSAIEVLTVEDPDNPGSFIDVPGGPTTSTPSTLLPIFGILDTTQTANTSTTIFSAVPEPSTWALWLGGALGMGAVLRRKGRTPA